MIFNINSIFNNSPKKPEKGASFSERRKFIKARNEEQENPFLYNFKASFAKYVTKPLLKKSTRLEYAKPLSILQHQEVSTFSNKDSDKILSSNEGGPTPEDIYNSALNLAKKLGWQEKSFVKKEGSDDEEKLETTDVNAQEENIDQNKVFYATETGIPVFITNRLRQDLKSFGFDDDEIDALKPTEAWNILQQKTLERDIINIGKEKIYKIQELDEDFSILQKIWNEAYDKMDAVNNDTRTVEILDLTAKTLDDPTLLEEYLKNNNSNLKPEERFFIEISIQTKKFRAKTKDLLYNGIESKDTEDSIITKEEFDNFVNNGKVSEDVLRAIVQKVMNGKQMSREELSVYVQHGKLIENILQVNEIKV